MLILYISCFVLLTLRRHDQEIEMSCPYLDEKLDEFEDVANPMGPA